jgi:hypothetical protein
VTKQRYFVLYKTAHNWVTSHKHLYIDLDLDHKEQAVLEPHPVKTLDVLFRIHFIFFLLQRLTNLTAKVLHMLRQGFILVGECWLSYSETSFRFGIINFRH